MSGDWLDPEEFPFTEAEVLDAASLWLSHEEARRLTTELVDAVLIDVSQRRAYREEIATLPPDPNRIVFFERRREDPNRNWLWPALSVLSDACAARAQDGMARRWQQQELAFIKEAQINELKSQELIAELMRLTHAGGNEEAVRALLSRTRREGIGIKEPTDEMLRAASETVERQKEAWLALAAESKRRLESRNSATYLPPPTPPRP